jgi:DNA-binding MarR family transcriptional regulator
VRTSTGPTTGSLIWRLSMKWRAAMDRTLVPLGLTHAQFSVLATLSGLSAAGRRPSQRELADLTGLEPIYVSKLARALEKAGLVDRPVAEDDPRAVQLTVTDRGREVAAEAIRIVHAKYAELTSPIGGPDGRRNRELRDTLLALLGDTPIPHHTRVEGEQAMTAPRTFNGRNINIAAAATRSILDTLIEREGITFPQYITLRALVGSSTERDALVSAVAGPVADEPVIREALDELMTAGLARVAAQDTDLIEATPQGIELFTRVTEASTRAGDQLFEGIAEADIAAAKRVLDLITERAAAVHAQL